MSSVVLRNYQEDVNESIVKTFERGISRQLVVMATGLGKCLGRDTPVLMYDGTIKPVQDIVEDDLVMGHDSKPRTVQGVTTGQEEMFEIVPTKGESWTCNKSHILTLVCNNKRRKTYNQLVDISVKEYLNKSKSFKHTHKLVSTGVDFQTKELLIDPYLLGVWLGDGTSIDGGIKISNPDKEIHDWFKDYCDQNNLNLNILNTDSCELLSITDDDASRTTPNKLTKKFRELNLFDNKHIPHQYKTGSREQRLQLLAGLLDTDGWLNDDGVTFEITQKSERLIDDIIFIVRSLGLACYKSKKIGKITSIDFEGEYWRINIIGDTNEIPTQILRKQANPRKQIKNPLRNGFKVKSLGLGTYYGFTLKEDPHFLLGNFTITHNTFSLTYKINEYIQQGKKCLVLVDQEELVWQWKQSLLATNGNLKVGIEKAEYKAGKNDQVVIATVQTLGRKGVKRIKKFSPEKFDLCVCDEADKSIADTWFRTLNYFGFGHKNFTDGNLLIGCTATPYRTDGASLGILYDDVVANYDTAYAIGEGWLTDISLYDVKTSTDLSDSKYSRQGEVDKAVDNPERNSQALKAFRDICKGKQTLIYCASVEHAYNLQALFESKGINGAVIEANTDKTERKQFLQDYKDKDLQVLFNYGTLTRGTDLPDTKNLMLLRPIKSKNLLQQIIGRGIRPSPTAHIDVWNSREERLKALELSSKPYCKIIDLYDKVGNHNFAHVPSLFGLNNELKAPKKKQFFKEVVEPIDRVKKEHGIDPQQIKSLDDIDLIVKNRKLQIKSLQLSPEVSNFTDRTWMETDSGYEIIYSEDNKALIIDKDQSKSELLDKTEWNLLEYDTKDGITKKLQTFNSLSGAFKVGDQYADQQKFKSRFQKKADWQTEGVTEKQLEMFNRFFKYKSGYAKFKLLNERYEDTDVRKVFWKETNEILDKGSASRLISNFFNS